MFRLLSKSQVQALWIAAGRAAENSGRSPKGRYGGGDRCRCAGPAVSAESAARSRVTNLTFVQWRAEAARRASQRLALTYVSVLGIYLPRTHLYLCNVHS